MTREQQVRDTIRMIAESFPVGEWLEDEQPEGWAEQVWRKLYPDAKYIGFGVRDDEGSFFFSMALGLLVSQDRIRFADPRPITNLGDNALPGFTSPFMVKPTLQDRVVIHLMSTTKISDTEFIQIWDVNGETYRGHSDALEHHHEIEHYQVEGQDLEEYTWKALPGDATNAIILAVNCGEGPINDSEIKVWERVDFEIAKKQAGLNDDLPKEA